MTWISHKNCGKYLGGKFKSNYSYRLPFNYHFFFSSTSFCALFWTQLWGRSEWKEQKEELFWVGKALFVPKLNFCRQNWIFFQFKDSCDNQTEEKNTSQKFPKKNKPQKVLFKCDSLRCICSNRWRIKAEKKKKKIMNI